MRRLLCALVFIGFAFTNCSSPTTSDTFGITIEHHAVANDSGEWDILYKADWPNTITSFSGPDTITLSVRAETLEAQYIVYGANTGSEVARDTTWLPVKNGVWILN